MTNLTVAFFLNQFYWFVGADKFYTGNNLMGGFQLGLFVLAMILAVLNEKYYNGSLNKLIQGAIGALVFISFISYIVLCINIFSNTPKTELMYQDANFDPTTKTDQQVVGIFISAVVLFFMYGMVVNYYK